jgi:hypothetical protein
MLYYQYILDKYHYFKSPKTFRVIITIILGCPCYMPNVPRLKGIVHSKFGTYFGIYIKGLSHEYWWILSLAIYHTCIALASSYNMKYYSGQYSQICMQQPYNINNISPTRSTDNIMPKRKETTKRQTIIYKWLHSAVS